MKIEEMLDLVHDTEEGKVDPIKAYIQLYELEKMAGIQREDKRSCH